MGLDDMTQADLSIPRLQIVNKKGVFRDSLANNEIAAMNVIVLGLVKQRTLWPARVGETTAKPMCRSNDHVVGFVNQKQPEHPFPYQLAELSQPNVLPRDDGQLTFNCADCKLKEWGSHPMGDKPYCNEVWALPLLMDPYGNNNYLPAVLNLSKTNIGPAKAYLGGFKASESAAFTAYTQISLQLLKRGDNEYSNIQFKRVGNTDSVNWAEWGSLYMEMRAFLNQEPRVFEEDTPAGPPPAPQPMAAQPTPAPVAAPVAAAPAPVVAPVAPAPVAQPAPEPAPVAQPTPQGVVQGEVVPNAFVDPNAPVDPWAGQTFEQPQPMQPPAAVAQEPVPQAAPPAPAPQPVAAPAPAPVAAATPPPVLAAVPPAPVSTPTPAAPVQPAPAPQPQAAAVAPTPAPSPVAQAPAPTASVQAPTSPAVPAASPQAVPGPDNDELPF